MSGIEEPLIDRQGLTWNTDTVEFIEDTGDTTESGYIQDIESEHIDREDANTNSKMILDGPIRDKYDIFIKDVLTLSERIIRKGQAMEALGELNTDTKNLKDKEERRKMAKSDAPIAKTKKHMLESIPKIRISSLYCIKSIDGNGVIRYHIGNTSVNNNEEGPVITLYSQCFDLATRQEDKEGYIKYVVFIV